MIRKLFSSARRDEFHLELKEILGFYPNNANIYSEAFTHRSMNEFDANGQPKNYERLEFLGDAMLDSVIAAYLFNEVPNGDEGYLTKMRAKVVSREHLNKLGEDLGLIKFLKSQIPSNQRSADIYGNMLEALIGAVYLDRGYTYCKRFIQNRVIQPYVDIERLEGKVISYKSLFIEYCQKNKQDFHFEVFEDNGKEQNTYFAVRLHLDDSIVARARGTSKKKAEEQAAKRAYYKFRDDMEALRSTQFSS
ncbi:MAG TPA: ribonuclease III [Flavobacteriaceae bacterium]|nr:ribonuclease III [Flavobacteriaceae bacterium]